MLFTTLARLRCPQCIDAKQGALALTETHKQKSADILFGTLACAECESTYPILAGIAVLVNDVERYLQFHVKGISALVNDADIPDIYRESYLQAKSEIEVGFTEEDLESKRINALYFMNHYLSASKAKKSPWWRPQAAFSKEIDSLVKNFWDHGPFAKIAEWTKGAKLESAIELGCGAGGLAQVLAKTVKSYLGVDSAFASIALARHINLGAPYALAIRIPQDLLTGALTGKASPPPPIKGGQVDFVVGDIESLPVGMGQFDLSVALNAIQSSPYIWHAGVAEFLRKSLPKKISSSSEAVEYLYDQAELKIFKKVDHIPWLFLKHFRQIEMYSVHLFAAKKSKPKGVRKQ